MQRNANNPRATHPIFIPNARTVAESQLTSFLNYCQTCLGRTFDKYAHFDQFSVEDFRTFWRLFVSWSKLLHDGDIDPVCLGEVCEGATFFPDLRLNYAENLLTGDPDRPAVTSCHRNRERQCLTRRELQTQVTALALSLTRMGVQEGDRVVAIARNSVEVVLAALATAAVGAIFSSCPEDMGVFAILTRFAPLSPVVLFGNFRPEPWDQGVSVAARVAEVEAGLPSLRAIIALDDGELPDTLTRPVHRIFELTRDEPAIDFGWPHRSFNQPLYILFSSGTTGAPKCIVHSSGGTLLEHIKEHRLHCDLRAGDKLFFQTSCGWMMWNWQLSALASGAELVLYDGPLEGPDTMWRLVAEEGVTVFGTNPAYLQYCEAAKFSPGHALDLSALRAVLSTGSILYPRQYDWVDEHVKALPLQSISGGTDIVGCFVLGNPNLPVYRGQAQCRSLGLDVRSLPPQDDPKATVGELICANPFPSCPLGFYGDADDHRFHDAYFSQNPGVWTHGDLIEFTEQGGAILHGRFDGILNIRGIRIGPAEIYRILQDFEEIAEAMAIEQEAVHEPGGTRLILLVVLRAGFVLDGPLTRRIRSELLRRGSSALVPARIAQVDELPITHSGKRSEAAARDAVNERPLRNRDALRNPGCLEAIANHPALRASSVNVRPGEQPSRDPTAGDSLERELQAICERVLDISLNDLSDNLFEYGADSLKILTLFIEIVDHTKCDLPIAHLFATPTIAGVASAIRRIEADLGRQRARSQASANIRFLGSSEIEPDAGLMDPGFGGVTPTTWKRLFVEPIIAGLDKITAPALLQLMPQVWSNWDANFLFKIFCWRYFDRPSDGGTWLAFDDDQCVAVIDSFIRPYLLNSKRILVREPADWFCLPEYRPFGLGLQLMRKMMERPEPLLAIGGTEGTRSLLPRLGWKSLPAVQRMVLPVTLRGLVYEVFRRKLPRYAKHARTFPGAIPAGWLRKSAPPANDASIEEWRPGRELTIPVPQGGGLIALLEPADLDWICRAPRGLVEPLVLVFSIGGESVGVSVSQLESSVCGVDGRIIHFQISRPTHTIVEWVVRETARRLAGMGVESIHCRVSRPPMIVALRKAGFLVGSEPAFWWAKDGTPPPTSVDLGYLRGDDIIPFEAQPTLVPRQTTVP